MDVPQSIDITQAGRSSLTLTVLEDSRIRFYATTVQRPGRRPRLGSSP